MTTDAIGDAERPLLDALGAISPSGVVGDPSAPVAPGSALSGALLRDVFDAALCSRHLDHTARWLRGEGLGF